MAQTNDIGGKENADTNGKPAPKLDQAARNVRYAPEQELLKESMI